MLEFNRNSPLFDHQLQINVKSIGQAENLRLLNLTVFNGSRAHMNQQEKFLHFEITSEDDFFFLFTLDIGEHDFHNLKKDQYLLVDFSGFSSKFIDLIQLCLKNRESTSSSHFVANLDTDSGIFSIVETNEFKHLNHLSLQFRPGNDACIKSYLAATLSQCQHQNELLLSDLENLRLSFDTLNSRHDVITEETNTIRLDHSKYVHELTSVHSNEKLQLQQAQEEILHNIRLEHDKVITDLKKALLNKGQELNTHVSQSQESYNALMQEKVALDYSYRHLEVECERLKPEVLYLRETLDSATAKVRTLENTINSLERECARVQATNEALREQISDKDLIVQKSESLRASCEEANKKCVQQVELYQSGLEAAQEKLKHAISEITRGNELIAELQSETQLLREKISSKNEILRKQESVLTRISEENKVLSEKEKKTTEMYNLSLMKQQHLESELVDVKRSVQDSSEIISRNQDVINHLNEMINSLQIGGRDWASLGGGMQVQANLQTPVSMSLPTSRQNFSETYPAYTNPNHEVNSREKLYDSMARPSNALYQSQPNYSDPSPKGIFITSGNQDNNMHAPNGDISSLYRPRHLNSPSKTIPKSTPSPENIGSNYRSGLSSPSSLKGYYDGLPMAGLYQPSANMESNGNERIHTQIYPSSQQNATVNHSISASSSKPKIYKWQEEDFAGSDPESK